MKVLFFVLVFPAIPYFLHSQVQDDFSDGNFSNNPTWQGDLANFVVNSDFELQLNAPDAGNSVLFLPLQISDSSVWEIFFRLEFPPSTSNQVRIYLQADEPDLLNSSGYYLEIGESGSEDALRFYRQDASTGVLLASATTGAVGSAPAVGRIKMTRNAAGEWNLFADYSNGFNFQLEFSIEDATYLGGSDLFFGFYCKYTTSRKDKFFFDDVKIAPLLPDTTAPELLAAAPISALEVDVLFSESLANPSAANPTNYALDNGIGAPNAAELDAADRTLVHLFLNTPLTSTVHYTLISQNLADLAGNVSNAQTTAFTYLEVEAATRFDILINEIMADPNPPVALPDVEFIELYNRSNRIFNLEDFGFSSGGTPVFFPNYTLLPDSYLIVCDAADVDSFAAFGEVVGLNGFPALVNSGDELSLTDPFGVLIHNVNYSINWYKDNDKEEGGWTLEMINPLAPCKGEPNWRASENLIGGTPGQPNSVLNAMPDETPPDLLRVFANRDNPLQLELFFSEALDENNAVNIANFDISNNISVASATFDLPSNEVVKLQLNTPLENGIIYKIAISSGLTDCSGNPIGLFNSLEFGLPQQIDFQDIVINEILFNPETGGVDFVEIFNRSAKIFNLSDLIIGNIRAGIDTTVVSVESAVLLFPGEYAVFTKNPSDIKARYSVENEKALIRNDLPAFNDDAGNVTLLVSNGLEAVVIDAFDYAEDFHNAFLDAVEGVSLERINPDATTQDRNNWHSAAEAAGFATPTFLNSQFISNQQLAGEMIAIPEPVFSPDGDGFKDFLLINYEFDQVGYTAKVQIFDAEGRFIKELANNELLATEGSFKWDGDTEEGRKARIGIYIVWIQLFTPQGKTQAIKKTCVLAGGL